MIPFPIFLLFPFLRVGKSSVKGRLVPGGSAGLFTFSGTFSGMVLN